MKKIIFTLCVLSPLTVFAASFKASDCQNTNWEHQGKLDGEQGKKIDLLYSYTKTCDKANLPFSADLYRKGREDGLYTYCSNQNAYNMGFKKTKVHKDVCAATMFPDFQSYYERGVSFKKIDKEKIAIDKKIVKLSKTIEILDQAKAESDKLEAQLNELSFKPEMAETQINRSTLMSTMTQPIMADPGSEASLNQEKPIDLEYGRGDIEDRQPAGEDPRLNKKK
jgi:hypothetical protein